MDPKQVSALVVASIPTAPTNQLPDWPRLKKNAGGQKGANSLDVLRLAREFSAARVTTGFRISVCFNFTAPQSKRTAFMLAPVFVGQRMAVKFVAIVPPLRHETVHQADESVPVMGIDKMNHFVEDDVFEAALGLLCQFGIETNRTRCRVRCAPFGFHVPHIKPLDRDADHAFPTAYQGRSLLPNLVPIKRRDDSAFFFSRSMRANSKMHLARA